MTRVLVAEDEAPQREALLRLLRALWPEAELVACADGAEALAASVQAPPAAAFLDLRMGGVDGLAVAEALRGKAHVVFVTAHADKAITAFEKGAVDYLLKPVRRERLAESVARLKERLATSPPLSADSLAALRQSVTPPPSEGWLQWITASVGDTVRLYPIVEVLAFRAQQKYTEVLCLGGSDATIRMSLRELLPRLDPQVFWQAHRSTIVRVTAIEELRKTTAGSYRLRLKGRTEELPAANAFRKRLRGM